MPATTIVDAVIIPQERWSMVTQFLNGLLLGGLVLMCVGVYLSYEIIKHWRHGRQSEREAKDATVEFDRTKTRALHLAAIRQANYKIGADRSLEVIHHYPVAVPAHYSPRIQIEGGEPGQALQLAAGDYPQVSLRTIVEELAYNQLQFT